jgi:hypothetical protein
MKAFLETKSKVKVFVVEVENEIQALCFLANSNFGFKVSNIFINKNESVNSGNLSIFSNKSKNAKIVIIW